MHIFHCISIANNIQTTSFTVFHAHYQEKAAQFINEQLKQAQCAKALEALQTQITGLDAYYTPERTLVHEGDVCLLTGKKTYHVSRVLRI